MNEWPSDYVEYVLDDIKKNGQKQETVKAGLLERLTKKMISPEKLHPNPEDEFSMEEIGPNLKIVVDYVMQINKLRKYDETIFEEPVVVEKLKRDGYMILNGHHRWLAALRVGVKKLHVKIVNLIHDEDIERMMDSSTNTRRAVFDLDEVLFAAADAESDAIPEQFHADRIPARLRAGAAELIRVLQKKGYDIWVYTGNYYSEGMISIFFELYDLKITGVINGVNDKAAGYSKETNSKLRKKYTETIHIDNNNMLITHSEVKGFEDIELEDPLDWKGSILKVLNTRE